MSTDAERTYWIDLTDLSEWRGYHTGIQRVVYNIARYYAESGQAKFFVYDDKRKLFHEVAFKLVEPEPFDPDPQPSKRRLLKQRLVYQAKETYSLLPEEWRQVLTPRLRPVAGAAYRRAHHVAHVASTIARPPAKVELVEAVFKPHDAIVIMGAGWARPGILNELWYRKQTVGFKMFHLIHDMIPVYFPHLFGPGHFELSVDYFFDVASTCDGIITNSVSTKNDYERFARELNLPARPVGVVRLGDEIPDRPVGQPPRAVKLEPGSFILAHGTIENRKNHTLLYYAYKLAAERGIKLPKLVITGRVGWNSQDVVFAFTHDPQVRDNVEIVGSVHDVELTWLFENSLYTVYPSTYEGWGLPVAESLVLGKFALTTPVSSMPEIAGDLIDYFSPYDSGDCLDKLVEYLNPAKLAAAEARVRAEYKVQTWRASYEEINAVVEGQLRDLEASSVN